MWSVADSLYMIEDLPTSAKSIGLEWLLSINDIKSQEVDLGLETMLLTDVSQNSFSSWRMLQT